MSCFTGSCPPATADGERPSLLRRIPWPCVLGWTISGALSVGLLLGLS